MRVLFAKVTKITRSVVLFSLAIIFASINTQGFLTAIVSAHDGNGRRHAGEIHVLTTVNGQRAGLGGIPVTLSHSSQSCHSGNSKNTDTNGVATFTGCGVSSNGASSATYSVTVGDTPAGYAINVPKSRQVEFVHLQPKDIHFDYSPLVNNPPPANNPPANNNPAPISDNDKNGRIRFISYIREPNGSLTRQGGLNVRTNAEGFSPEYRSADGKTALNCDDHNKTTDQAGGSPTANANYGMAHFSGCWTGSKGSKEYQVYAALVPANYKFRSLHIDNGTFVQGGTSTTDSRLPVTFKVYKDQEVQLQFWIEKVILDTPTAGTPPGGGGGGSGSAGSSGSGGGSMASSGDKKSGGAPNIVGAPSGVVVRQVIGTRQSHFIAVRGGEAAVNIATILTQQLGLTTIKPPINVASCTPDPDDPEECFDPCDPDPPLPSCPDYVPEDVTAPPTPQNFRIKVSDSGRPELSWDKVEGDIVLGEGGKPDKDDNGNDVREDISYRIERITASDPPNQPIVPIAELSSDTFTFTDDEDSIDEPSLPAKLPGSYTYRLYSLDDQDTENVSTSPAVQEITIVVPPPQVDDEDSDSPDTPSSLTDGSNPNPSAQGVRFSNSSETIVFTVPQGAGGEEPLACAVVNKDSVGRDLAQQIGEIQTTTQGISCTDSKGEEVEEYEEEVETEFELENSLIDEDTELYGYDGTDWVEIDTEGDGSTGEDTTLGYTKAGRVKGDKTTFKVSSKKRLTLAIIDKQKQIQLIKIAGISAMTISLVGVVFVGYVIINRRKIQQRALHPYDDVDLTPLNPRVDYTPTLTAPAERDDEQRGSLVIRLINIFVFVILILTLLLSINFRAFAAEQTTTATPKETCESQTALLNSRSAILNQYRKTEEGNYQKLRANWAKRTTYAGQWVTKDSEKTRESIYKLDGLHKQHMEEVARQIDVFIPLESNPLNCSATKKETIAEKIKEAYGKKDGKKSTGYYLIKYFANEEIKHQKGDFKKVSEKMVDKLHDSKEKNPKPEKSMTIVEKYQ